MALSPVVTAANNAGFIPVIYAAEALKNEREKTLVGKMFADKSAWYNGEGRGGSVLIPQAGMLSASDMGTEVTTQDPAASSKTITLNKWRECSFVIRKDMKAKTGELLAREHIDDAAAVLATDFEDYILGLHAGFTTTTVAATTDTGDNLLGHIREARLALNKADSGKVCPRTDRMWIFSPDLEDRLFTVDQFIRADYKESKPMEDGYFAGYLLGSPVYISTLIDSTTVSSTTTYSNLYVHRSAIGYIVAFDDFETNYIPEQKGTLYSGDMLYGATVLYPKRGVVITCTATA